MQLMHVKIAVCSAKSLVETFSERDIKNSDGLIQLDSFTFVIFKGVCLHV